MLKALTSIVTALEGGTISVTTSMTSTVEDKCGNGDPTGYCDFMAQWGKYIAPLILSYIAVCSILLYPIKNTPTTAAYDNNDVCTTQLEQPSLRGNDQDNGGRRAIKKSVFWSAPILRWASIVHNSILVVLSLYLSYGIGKIIWQTLVILPDTVVKTQSLMWPPSSSYLYHIVTALCDNSALYINDGGQFMRFVAYSKMIELGDTIYRILSRRFTGKVIAFQMWHHSSQLALLCIVWNTGWGASYLGLFMNSVAHVLAYAIIAWKILLRHNGDNGGRHRLPTNIPKWLKYTNLVLQQSQFVVSFFGMWTSIAWASLTREGGGKVSTHTVILAHTVYLSYAICFSLIARDYNDDDDNNNNNKEVVNFRHRRPKGGNTTKGV